MSKRYTAQEMRETAKDIEADLVFSPPSDMDDVMHRTMAMLRQAADDLERDKKYEYEVLFRTSQDDEMMERTKAADLADAEHLASLMRIEHGDVAIYRREVGEWKEVKE